MEAPSLQTCKNPRLLQKYLGVMARVVTVRGRYESMSDEDFVVLAQKKAKEAEAKKKKVK